MATPAYLKPYVDATRSHGGGFSSLLWASPETQAARFDAFTRVVDFRGVSVLDLGAGRADFLDYLVGVNVVPGEYIAVEAVEDLAAAADVATAEVAAARGIVARVARRDFIAEPACMFTASDIIVVSGALNTCPDDAFYATLKRAYDATAHHLVFNFLSSTNLAAAGHLYWRGAESVERFCVNVLSARPRVLDDYLRGDTTFVLTKRHE